MMRQSRSKLIEALADCIDMLCQFALMETSGPILRSLQCDDRIWFHLSEDSIQILDEALGMKEPEE